MGSDPSGPKPGQGGQPDGGSPYWGGSPPDRNVQLPSLPQPAPAKATAPEDAARDLAGRVLAGGDGALPALLAALQASGIGVIDSDHTVLVTPAVPSQGWSIEHWEALALSLHPEGQTLLGLPDLLVGLGSNIVGSPEEAAPLVLADLRELARSESPTKRFFGLFIVELGRQGPQEQDVLDGMTPYMMLGGLQAELIVRRLVTDLNALRLKLGAPGLTAGTGNARRSLSAPSNAPCSMTDTASTIMDGAAVGSGFGFGQLMGYLIDKKGLGGAEALGRATSMGSVALAWSKLFLYYANLKADVHLQGSPPLERTKNTQPGKSDKLIAEASFDVSNLQMVNCFRIMLNALGMDLSLPPSGALAGSSAEWDGLDGFGSGPGHIVQFHGDPVHGRTDDNGKAEILVEGAPQKFTLPETSAPVMKKARARFLVAPKPPSFKQDILDAAAAASGGVVGLVGTAPVEAILRTKMFKPFDYTFDVKDWTVPWKGKLTLKQSGKNSQTVSPAPGATLTTSATIDRTFVLAVTGVLLEMPNPFLHETTVQLKTVTIPDTSQTYTSHDHHPEPCETEGGCNPPPPPYDDTYEEKLTGKETSDSSVVLHLREDGSYDIDVSLQTGKMTGTWSDSWTKKHGDDAESPGGPIEISYSVSGGDPNAGVIDDTPPDTTVVKTISPAGPGSPGSRAIDVSTTVSVAWHFERGTP